MNRLLRVLIGLALLGVVLLSFLPELEVQRRQNARREELAAELRREQEELAKRTRQGDLLQNDPAYLESVARDRLDLMKEGETIILLDHPPVQ